MASVEDLFREIVNERGGEAALGGAVNLALARALAVALTDNTIVPSVVASLTNMLPPTRNAGAPAFLDLTRLTDEQLDQLERIAHLAGTNIEPEQPLLADAHRQIAELHEMVKRADERTHMAESAELTYRSLCDSRDVRIAGLEAALNAQAPIVSDARQLVHANETGGAANQVAAELLTVVLENVSIFQPATRQ